MEPTIGTAFSVSGHSFQWTCFHRHASELHPLLYSYDELATDVLNILDEISPPTTKGWKCPHGSGPGQRDLYALLERHAADNPVLGQLWPEVTTAPDWVNWEQIKRGQRVVYQFHAQILTGLLFTSLLGGMSAGRAVETLSRTGGFGVQVMNRRLLETAQHFMEVIDNVDAVKPGGQGFVSSVRVRLLHAAVRRRLLQLEEERPGYFDVSQLGMPINDLHCIGTVCMYSCALIWMALPRQGIFLTHNQTADYLARWRYVGYLLGTPVDWMSTPEEAKAMLESLILSEFRPTTASKILANNILTAQANIPPVYTSRELLAANAYRLNGIELSNALGIEAPTLYYRMLSLLQCVILLCINHIYGILPARIQMYRDKRFKERMSRLIHHKAFGLDRPSTFNFQYLPDWNKSTELGASVKAKFGDDLMSVSILFSSGGAVGMLGLAS